MFGRSLRSRIQSWHTFLLTLIVSGLLAAFYFHEKEILLRELDQLLSEQVLPAIPQLLPLPGERRPSDHDGSRNRRPGPSDRIRGERPSHPPFGPGDTPRERPPFGGSFEQRDQPPNQRPYDDSFGPPGRTQPEPDSYRRQAPQNAESANSLNRARLPTREGLESRLVQQNIYIIAYDLEGEELDRSRNAPEDRAKAEMTKQNMSRTIGNYREYVHVDPRGYTLILGQPLDKLNSQLMNLRLKLLAIGIALVCFGFGIGWLLAGQALKPIRSISRTAAQIADGDLSQRIDSTETESELGQLVQVLNTTFSKLDASFEQQVRFTADASHELRTPISVILAKCQFALRRDREAEKYRQTLGECEKSAQHLRGLVESLLQLARVDSGEFSLKKENHDLGTIAMEAAHALDPLAEEKHIGFDLDCPITAANFDKERIFQVMTNLISNAIKYTQESGRIRVSTRKTEGRVSFTVEDNGNGIEKAQIPYLFDRFYRGERDRTNEHRSTGLGLAIVKSIVDAHDGSLSVESAPGKGSTFTVSLPCTS